MTWVHVQGTSGASTSLTFGSAVTAGDLIVVSVAEFNSGAGTITCKDSINNTTYTQVAQVSNSGNQIAVFWFLPPVGGSSFTVTASDAYYSSMTIDEYSFPAGSTAVIIDSSGTAIGPASLASSLTVTGTDLIYAACAVNGPTVAAGSGFTQRGQVAYVYAVDIGITSEDYLNVSSNINPSFATAPEAMIGVAFKALSPYTFNAAGLAISGAFGGATAGPSPGVAGMAISGYPGGTSSSIFAPLAGLAISGYPGGATAGPSPAAAGLAISGGCGGITFPISSPAAGMAISGAPGGTTAGPSPGVAGMAISGSRGGIAGTVTVVLAGLSVSGYPGGATGGEYLGPFYLPYEYTSVPIETGNENPFGIDPERTTIITVGLTPSD